MRGPLSSGGGRVTWVNEHYMGPWRWHMEAAQQVSGDVHHLTRAMITYLNWFLPTGISLASLSILTPPAKSHSIGSDTPSPTHIPWSLEPDQAPGERTEGMLLSHSYFPSPVDFSRGLKIICFSHTFSFSFFSCWYFFFPIWMDQNSDYNIIFSISQNSI